MVTDAELASWFEGKEFTTDWIGRKAQAWFDVFAPLRYRSIDILEVGAFEGRSAVLFLNYFPSSTLTTIDSFQSSSAGQSEYWQQIEQRCDSNLAGFGDRATKVRDHASNALVELAQAGRQFEIVYLDAGKQREWVFALSSLAWPLIQVGGFVIWDDFTWGPDRPSEEKPRDAIRLFTGAFAKCLSIEHSGSQLIARKTADWPRGYRTEQAKSRSNKP